MPKKRRGNGSAVSLLNPRAEDIIQNGMIPDTGSMRYRVPSRSAIHAHHGMACGENGWRCSCPYHTNGNRRCKHIRAVAGLVMKERRLLNDEIKKTLIKEPKVT